MSVFEYKLHLHLSDAGYNLEYRREPEQYLVMALELGGDLRQRLRQNGVQEKIGALWIDRSLRKIGAR